MTPIGDAQSLWNNPKELIDLWDSLESKTRHEKLIANLLGNVSIVADLGCGVGRFSKVLDFDQYYGYDSSHEMIIQAVSTNNKGGYACVDILKFASDLDYDTAICIDVVYHLNDPLKAIKTIFNNFRAKRYVFTLLVNHDNQQDLLYNSCVIAKSEFTRFEKSFNIKTLHEEQIEREHFNWMVLEYKK